MCAVLTMSILRGSNPRSSTAAACSRSRWSRSQRRTFHAVAELLAAKRPALIPVADGVGRKLCVGRERGGAVLLGTALRPIAEAEGGRVVPPAARVIGRAIEYLVADLGVLEADADQLQEVLRRNPDRQPTPIDRRVAEIADADAGDAQSMLECIQRAVLLAEGLAHPITTTGPHGRVDRDASAARIKPDHVVRRGEPPPFAALPTRRLEQVIATDDVGLQDRVPRSFDREAAEM